MISWIVYKKRSRLYLKEPVKESRGVENESY